jgi:hypothetical protein
MPEPLPSVADRIDRVGDVPFQVWPPLANSGRARWHQGVLYVGQAVFDRIVGAATPHEQVTVLRGIPCVDTAALEDGEAVRLWREPGGPSGRPSRTPASRRTACSQPPPASDIVDKLDLFGRFVTLNGIHLSGRHGTRRISRRSCPREENP